MAWVQFCGIKKKLQYMLNVTPPLEKGGALSQINDMIGFLLDFSLLILNDFLHEEGHCRSLISQPEETTVAILLFISHYGSRDRLWHSGYDD